ncbi:MAG: SPOR domain-containing protein [Spirochaetes bacterium]|uniref:SPOR domain-containing protein n=1 Tax=Candidatus Avitreponema avistercoris TaxID=2840705 RepID=A0A9D9ENV5_9SPIR|nr:SPOR domain-containing protein [Candidatus Avitreponema avistercoris]
MSAARLPLSAVFFSLLFSGILLPVFAEPSSASPPPAADPAAAFAAALEQAGDQDVSGAFADALRAFPEGEDRRQLLVWFADYEERSNRFDRAAEYYTLAAETPPVDFPLYLDAARCLLYMNETAQASARIQTVLLECLDAGVLARARFYAVCVRLSDGDSAGAFSQIRTYLGNGIFTPYFPQMLFLLWYAGGDRAARDQLLERWPSSMEAAVVRGEAVLAPQAFWYLMPSERARLAGGTPSQAAEPAETAEADADAVPGTGHAPVVSAAGQDPADASGSPDPVEAGIWQQTGFFRSRANAEAQAEELAKAGFRVFIRQENRSDGGVFFSVLVPEDRSGTTALRLKDKGFESYLVTEEN